MTYKLKIICMIMLLSMVSPSCGLKADQPTQLAPIQPPASTVLTQPSAEPSISDDADTSSEPGEVVPKEEIKSYENHVTTADVPEAEGLKDTLPGQKMETYDLSGLISGTELDGLPLSECIQYAQGDIVLFLSSKGKWIETFEGDLAAQLRETQEGSQYSFIGCFYAADYYLIVLSDDEARGEKIITLYTEIMI